MDRSSSTRQPVPTPRQSQTNRPRHSSNAAASSRRDSPWLRPSVRRMAWRGPGRSAKRSLAARNHLPIAVPPSGVSPPIAVAASRRVRALLTASPPVSGYTTLAVVVPATTANLAPSGSRSTAATAARLVSGIVVAGKRIEEEQSTSRTSESVPSSDARVPPSGGSPGSPSSLTGWWPVTVIARCASDARSDTKRLWSTSSVKLTCRTIEPPLSRVGSWSREAGTGRAPP